MENKRKIALFTTEGVTDCDISNHQVLTEDGLTLSLQRFNRDKNSKDVVVIMHGLTTSTDMFIMPEHKNLVSYLLDNDYGDVFGFDFRMSNRHSYNMRPHRFNMDDIALNDMPAGIAKVRELVGDDARIHVIAHCLGSVSFAMSLFAKKVSGIHSVIFNSVSLTPRVSTWSKMKLGMGPLLIERVLGLPYIDPRWSEYPFLSRGKLLSKAVSLFHRECDNSACHMLSFMWGSGHPALYHHHNLADVTHERGGDLYGPTAVNYHRHVNKMVKNNNTAVKYKEAAQYQSLPNNYFEHAKDIETPILFMTGKDNHIFTDSNIEAHRRLEELVPGRHQLHIFEGYGHQDVFMGKTNHIDIFPRLLDFLNETVSKAEKTHKIKEAEYA